MIPHPTLSPPDLVRKRSSPLDEEDAAVSQLWAASFQKLLGPLEQLTEQWVAACSLPESPLRDETLAALALSGGAAPTRRLLLDALYASTFPLHHEVPTQGSYGMASSSSWLPASPPDSSLEHGFSLPLLPTHANLSQISSSSSSSNRNRSWSQPVDSSSRPRAYENSSLGNRSRVIPMNTSPAFLPPLPSEAAGWYDASPGAHEYQPSPTLGLGPGSSQRIAGHYVSQPSGSSYSAITLPALPSTSSSMVGTSSPGDQPRNTAECFVLHDRELQARYPNDALEKSVQTLELVEQTPGPVDGSGMPTTLLKFSALDPFPRTKITYHLAVLSGDTLTTLTPDGRQRSPNLAIFRFSPGDFVLTPNSPIGSSPWWRQQECRGPHPSTGGGNWTARFDQNNMRRRARILGHFATCQLGDVATSLRAFANSLKTAGEERSETGSA